MEIAGIKISHPDKIIFPDLGLTKGEMVEYYEKISEYMLPHLKNRPLTLLRFPDGIEAEGFHQKNVFDYFPDFISRVEVPTESGNKMQFYCDSLESLIYFANQGTVSFHTWLARQDRLNEPDKVVFDLDPPDNGDFEEVKESAQLIKKYLRKKGKKPQLMTTGKTGLHIWYPAQRVKTFDERRDVIKSMALELEEMYPELLTTEVRIENRENKIFLDYLRNAYGQTSVCPYSLRSNASAGVATPLEWSELSAIDSADHYTYQNIFRRLGQK
ncbi:non-homologous end-joining DNA ligase [Membranicola marinus]|uniref:Non-homologous end-joining DNA ligase n=1 Tax=Membranihabitans marinus TaxID=1227546 RepID=A0A953HXM2_9BACT|nr:non-homologous end-joining DNA ligase [Membranihabitans marinus]MBY5960085.1 non-homologous end-joining DNA ligase [Membranihabitans marinus]